MTEELDPIAQALPDYEIGEELGRGQFAIVWRGRHRQLERAVAIKQLVGAAGAEQATRFRREAMILASIDHPHVVAVYDYREQGQLRLLVLELLSGGTFADRRAADMSVDLAVESTIAAASGLHFVHEQGVLHRDVKPENLMFDRRGTLKVTDFGVARGALHDANGMNVTYAGDFFGTPAYASPEQLDQALGEGSIPVSAASDQYGLAAVLYEALCGQLTHDSTGGAAALCARRLREEARPLRDFASDLPAGIESVVMRALARDPRERYATMQEFADALADASTGAPPAPATTAARVVSPVVAPLPARLESGANAVFAGRAQELDRWSDAWKAVRGGERRIWLVSGEAGIGKTTLVSQIAANAHADDSIVLYGRCDEDLGVPYQPWIEALSSLVANAPIDVLGEHVAARGAVLARVVPELSVRCGVEPPLVSDAEAERFALFGAVTDLLARVSTRSPLLVVIDDLHWADKPTVQLLRHLGRVADPMRVMVVGTYRSTDVTSSHPLADSLTALRREPGVDFVELGGLDDLELLVLIEAIAGHEMGSEGVALRDAISAETNGSPFFATEILRHLAETGAIVHRDGRWESIDDLAQIGLPVSVRQVVGDRIARLGPEAERLLRMAAVIGRDFDLGLLVEVADVDEDEALDLLDSAVSAALVQNVAVYRYTFAHALVQHALYEDLTASRRGRVHRRIAQALEERCGSDPGERVGELAYHWSSAIVPDDAAKAIDYARRAGDRALAQLAPDEAIRWYSQALELQGHEDPDDDRLRVTLLVGLGTAQRQVGDPAHRATLLDAAQRARAVGDDDLLVAAALANHRGWSSFVGTIDEERVEVIRAALEAVGPGDSRERVRLLSTLVAELTFTDDAEPRRLAVEEAVAIARRLQDDQALVAALIGQLSLPDRPNSDPLRVADEVLEIAASLGDHTSLGIAAASALTSAASFGDRARFDRYASICAEASAHVNQPDLLTRAKGAEALIATIDGELATAEAVADAILPFATETGFALVYYGTLLITVRGQQGRGADIRGVLAALAGDEQGSASELARAGLLLTDVQMGDLDVARAGFADHAQRGFAARDDQLWLTAVCVSAHVCARLGEKEHAEELLRLLEPFIDLVAANPAGCLFTAASCAGALAALLNRYEEAERYFTRAVELTTNFRAPYLLASAQVDWGRALMSRQPADVERARPLLSEALDTARRFGYGDIERQSESLLVDTAAT